MSQYDDFITQIRSVAALITENSASLEPAARTLLSTPEIHGLRHIILTGSGDSYFAAAAVAPAMRGWTGLPVQAMTAMEAARYVDHAAEPRSVGAKGLLVLPISYSGEAARVVEATRRLRQLGGLTAALTANAQSRLGQAAERQLDTRIADSTAAPGTRNYVASMIGLYLIAIRIAEVRITITMDQASALRKRMIALGGEIEGLAEQLQPQAEDLMQRWQGLRSFDVLGAGPGMGSAGYTAAKLVEASGVHAAAQDMEEFHHLNYFVDRPEEIGTIAFAPSAAASQSRAVELAETLRQLGRPHVFISDQPLGGETLVIPRVEDMFSPLVETIPAALLAAAAARVRSATHYRGHSGAWAGARGAGLIKDSKIVTLEEQQSC